MAVYCFHPLSSVNSAAINMGIQMSFQTVFNSFTYKPGSGIARSYGNSSFNSLRNYHTVFHNYTILHSHHSTHGFQFFKFLTYTGFLLLFIVAILLCVQCYVIIVLIYISND